MKRAIVVAALFCLFLLCLAPSVRAAASNNLILNVPDWNQPADGYWDSDGNYHQYTDTNGNPIVGYPEWCSPTAGANIMGYWEDVKGCIGLADGFSNLNNWPTNNSPANPATPNTWHQGLWHDGNLELGWYMDTDKWKLHNGPFPPQQPPPWVPTGTQFAKIGSGLEDYAKAGWHEANPPNGTGIVKTAFPNAIVGEQTQANDTIPHMWDIYVTEINSGHPAELSFDTWIDLATGPEYSRMVAHQGPRCRDL